ncbi:Gti1/Pac2 family transcription factor [Entomortierella parvispora]|uniref:Gti1/Pac2 family transcription factor n=1 Tax=Entomortierella parvispora TaxID=205924 RepID=A0A9P3LXX1_9FUNG|nr:Gti1/Pac2 family transcription factor [Entomortierella parvispora]
MAKAFHGRIDDTLDALIILEGCRQGILPTLTRRLLAAERGDPAHLSSSSESKDDQQVDGSGANSTATSKDTGAPKQTPLIMPGSVFVFDEGESGIYRWTDGRIWSPSRICGNFLVYRELLRKVPNQKCHTPADKARMKNGAALKDKLLKQKVEEDGLTVMGCVKGTFILKKDGLIKKTICVKGATVPMPHELQKLQGKSCSKNGYPPGFAVGDMQHLVCYEKSGAMENLHRPRDYKELRDLTLSKSFIITQKYRNPIEIRPPPSADGIFDPFDEYVTADRISEHTQRTTPKGSKDAKTEARTVDVKRRLDLEYEDGSSELSDAEDYADDDEAEPDGREQVEDDGFHRSNQGYPPQEQSFACPEPDRYKNEDTPMVSTDAYDAYDVAGHPYLTRNVQRRIQNLRQERASRTAPYFRSLSKRQPRRGMFPSIPDTDEMRQGSNLLHSHVPVTTAESYPSSQLAKSGAHRSFSPSLEYDLVPDRLSSVQEGYFRHDSNHSLGSSQTSRTLAFLYPGSSSGRNSDSSHSEDLAAWGLAHHANYNDREDFGNVHQVSDARYRPDDYYESQYSRPIQKGASHICPDVDPATEYHIGASLHQQMPFHTAGLMSSSQNVTFHPQVWYSSDIPHQVEAPIMEGMPSTSGPCECCSFAACGEPENTLSGSPFESCEVKSENFDVAVSAPTLVDTADGPQTMETSIEYFGPTDQLQAGTKSFPATPEESGDPPYQREHLKEESPLDPQTFSPAPESQEFPINTFDWSTVDQDQFNVVQQSSPTSSDYAEARRALGANEYMLHMQHLPLSQSSQTRLYPNQMNRKDGEPSSDVSTDPPSAYCQGNGVHEDLIFYSEMRSRVGLLEPSSDSASTHPLSDPAPSNIDDCSSGNVEGVSCCTADKL